MLKKYQIGFSLFILMLTQLGNRIVAQTLSDTTIQLNPVAIISNKATMLAVGHRIQHFDSSQIQYQSNVSNLLLQNSAIYIRSYGLGSLSTLSLRGSASTHTAVLWNGINIQSPMNGIFDLSLLPSFFLDEIEVRHGAAGALTGSSAIGGNLILNNQTRFNSGWQITSLNEVGSFNKFLHGVSLSYGNHKWYVSTKLFGNRAKNDFKFINAAQFGKPKQNQSNAKLNQYGLLHEQSFDLKRKRNFFVINIYQFKIWLQNNQRELPPSMTMLSSEAQQEDKLIRIMNEWKGARKKWSLLYKNAYFNEQIIFEDSKININDKNKAQTILNETEWTYTWNSHHSLLLGVNFTFHFADSKNFKGQNPTQRRTAYFASYHYTSVSGKWNTVVSLRKEQINQQRTPITPAYQQTFTINSVLKWKSALSRTFRVPTFNDWYWIQGGNPDLKSEKGWAAETGIELTKQWTRWAINYTPTFFAHTLNQRIIWLPDDAGIWRPENLLRVNVRGLEQSLHLNTKFGKLHFQLLVQYTFLKSTNDKNSPKKQEAGKQIIYTPKNNGLLQLQFHYQSTNIKFTYQLNGKVYYTADNSKSISASQVSYISIAQDVKLKSHSFQFFIKINNLFNQNYQVILWRAMPLRYYELGFQYNFLKPLKTKK